MGSGRGQRRLAPAWGGALLSKYHAVFLPAGTLLYLSIEPTARLLACWAARVRTWRSRSAWWSSRRSSAGTRCAWLGVSSPSRAAVGASPRFRPETLGGSGAAGVVPLPLDLVPAGEPPDRSRPAIAGRGDAGGRPVLAQPVGLATGHVSGPCGQHPPGLAALDNFVGFFALVSDGRGSLGTHPGSRSDPVPSATGGLCDPARAGRVAGGISSAYGFLPERTTRRPGPGDRLARPDRRHGRLG